MQAKANVLFVDDEERIVNLLRLMFRTTYQVFTATSGAQALEIIRAQQIHVIVSDQRMPGMLGIELLSQVRHESPDTVRLLLTGYSDLSAIVGSVNDAEVFRFINKPWDQEDIRATVAEAAEIGLLSAAAPTTAVREKPAAPVAGSGAGRLGILLLDDSRTERLLTAQVLVGDYVLHHAASVTEALVLLATHEIGVMVCESQIGNEDTGELLHLLKSNYPGIITVMLTQSGDSDMVIRLINQARIYRFTTKPIRQAMLQLAVSAAMNEHVRCMTDMRHAARQRPVKLPELEQSARGSGILQGLRSLTARWKMFST
jgi:DNA-binding NtrC family response regulator